MGVIFLLPNILTMTFELCVLSIAFVAVIIINFLIVLRPLSKTKSAICIVYNEDGACKYLLFDIEKAHDFFKRDEKHFYKIEKLLRAFETRPFNATLTLRPEEVDTFERIVEHNHRFSTPSPCYVQNIFKVRYSEKTV